jgi:hypothetical protein
MGSKKLKNNFMENAKESRGKITTNNKRIQ